jgi:hypothetical protein
MMTKAEIVQMIIDYLAKSYRIVKDTAYPLWTRWDINELDETWPHPYWYGRLDLSNSDAVETILISPDEVSTMLDLLGPTDTFELLVYAGEPDRMGVRTWMRLGQDERYGFYGQKAQ